MASNGSSVNGSPIRDVVGLFSRETKTGVVSKHRQDCAPLGVPVLTGRAGQQQQQRRQQTMLSSWNQLVSCSPDLVLDYYCLTLTKPQISPGSSSPDKLVFLHRTSIGLLWRPHVVGVLANFPSRSIFLVAFVVLYFVYLNMHVCQYHRAQTQRFCFPSVCTPGLLCTHVGHLAQCLTCQRHYCSSRLTVQVHQGLFLIVYPFGLFCFKF
ncbi:hypothetical protein J6590_003284 [Homalodisca vitripennis]|nr:hypothetical protein J6590_003284 [Homalodisca vitripennis]